MKNSYTMSALARLMAGENISVTHSPKMDTAMFDLEKRELVLPVWGDMSPALYDLLLTHEISHALHTPLQGWHKSLSDLGRGFKGYLNVIEDARIERLIKDKYPGLVRVFSTAYSELVKRDFFGLTKHKLNPNSLPLIDRINLHAKAGAFFHLTFTAEEQALLDAAYTTETFNDVRALAERIYKREQLLKKAKKTIQVSTRFDQLQKEMEQAREMLRKMREKGAEDIDEGDFEEAEEGEVVAREKQEGRLDLGEARETKTEAEKLEDEEIERMRKAMKEPKKELTAQEKADAEVRDEERFNETSATEDLNDYSKIQEQIDNLQKEIDAELDAQKVDATDEQTSVTDEAFREAEESLVDPDVKKHLYGSDEKILVLNDVDLTKFVAPASVVNAAIDAHMKEERVSWYIDSSNNYEGLQKFLRDESKVLSQLVSEFEMRKNAAQYARAGQAKTGAINMKRLHAAGLVDDIFQRITKVPEGKSHGMMMFFDQSGSMEYIYKRTLEQMIILVEFCRRMNIPFDVYGFSDDWGGREAFFSGPYSEPAVPTPGRVQMTNTQGYLKQYIHSGMSTTEYKKALLNLWRLRDRNLRPKTEGLNGTPMNQAIALSGQLVRKFRLKTKVDVVNAIFLTDGEATDNLSVNSNGFAYNTGTCRVLYQDKLSERYKLDSYNKASCTAALVNLMVAATGANYIGIYVPDHKRSVKTAMERYHRVTFFGKHKESKFSIEKDGFFMTENYGFNSFFILKPLEHNLKVSLADVDAKKSTSVVAKQFSKAAAARVQNRAFLAVFATQIAKTL